MKYVQVVAILVCLAIGSIAPGQVPVDLENDQYDIGLVVADQIPEGKADTLIVYSASWCGPCIRMRPVWTLFRSQGYKVVYIDVDNPHKYDGKWDYQSKELVDRMTEKLPDSVPAYRYYNSQTEELLEHTIEGPATIKKVKEHLWKTSSSKAFLPVQRR